MRAADLLPITCPICRELAQHNGTVWIEEGEWDEAEQTYEAEGDYPSLKCAEGHRFVILDPEEPAHAE
jgi:hypothetical protein